MNESHSENERMSRVKSALIRGFGAATIAGSPLSGAMPRNAEIPPPMTTNVSSHTVAGSESIVAVEGDSNTSPNSPISHEITSETIDRRMRIIREIETEYGIAIFSPERALSSSTLIDEYQAQEGAFISENDTTREGLDGGVAMHLIGSVARNLGIDQDHMRDADFSGRERYERVICPWTEHELRIVQGVLKLLPKKFVQLLRESMHASKGPLRLYLLDERVYEDAPSKKHKEPERFREECFSGFYFGGDYPAIVLPYDSSSTNDADKRVIIAQGFIHELTHFVVFKHAQWQEGKSRDILTQQALKSIGVEIDGTQTRGPIHQLLDSLIASGDILVKNKDDGSREYIGVSLVGYGALDLSEFLPMANYYYLTGRKNFLAAYSPALGEERAQKMYEYICRVFFGGWEYGLEELMQDIYHQKTYLPAIR